MAEAELELNKNKSTISYFDIYKKHQISDDDFKEALNYYSKSPQKLELIYTNILEQLTKEKSMLDQQ